MVFPPNTLYETVASIRLERRESARNRRRFQTVTVPRTLLGWWALVREWGRIGQLGTVRETWFETEGEAWAAGKPIWYAAAMA